jgi:hypothetical protein
VIDAAEAEIAGNAKQNSQKSAVGRFRIYQNPTVIPKMIASQLCQPRGFSNQSTVISYQNAWRELWRFAYLITDH